MTSQATTKNNPRHFKAALRCPILHHHYWPDPVPCRNDPRQSGRYLDIIINLKANPPHSDYFSTTTYKTHEPTTTY